MGFLLTISSMYPALQGQVEPLFVLVVGQVEQDEDDAAVQVAHV